MSMLLHIRQSSHSDPIPIEVESSASIKDVFGLLDDKQFPMNDFCLSFGGVRVTNVEEKLSELGIGAECEVELLPLTQKEKVLNVFKETNAQEIMQWDIQSDNCCDWRGIHCHWGTEYVYEIVIGEPNIGLGYNLKGRINLSMLPKTLVNLCLMDNELYGSIDLTNLPHSLKLMLLSGNQFSGSLDLTKLPPRSVISLSGNNFDGYINIGNLKPLERRTYHNNLIQVYKGQTNEERVMLDCKSLKLEVSADDASTQSSAIGYIERDRTQHFMDDSTIIHEPIVINDDPLNEYEFNDNKIHIYDAVFGLFGIGIIFMMLCIYRYCKKKKQEEINININEIMSNGNDIP